MSEELLVRKIENGTVLDHIPAGKGLDVVKLLDIDLKHDQRAVILANVQSKKFGSKDVIKIENKQLTEDEVKKIALLAPDITLNIIKNWEVVEKKKVELPEVVEGVINCPNSDCITNTGELTDKKFKVEKKNPLRLRCFYCEKSFGREDIV